MSKIPQAVFTASSGKPITVQMSLDAIDRLEQGFGKSFLSLADEIQEQFERGTEKDENGVDKAFCRMTGASVRIGFAAKFLGVLLNISPDEVMSTVPRGKIIKVYADCVDPFFDVVHQITGTGEDSESPTEAGASTVSGESKPGLEST